MSQTRMPLFMVVAERGSAWTSWVERFSEESANVEVLVQRRNESGTAFGQRIRRRLSEMSENGTTPERAVWVGGGRRDLSALRSRSVSVRALASGMARRGGGEVYLDSTAKDRISMLAIAETIADLVKGTGVHVHAANDNAIAAEEHVA